VRRSDVLGRSRDQQIIVDDLTASQEKADADVEQVKTRRKRDQDRMDQGLISNPKDLERMQHELESLERRIATREDEELEVMEDLEAAQAELTTMRTDLAETEERLTAVTELRDQRQADIDADLERIAGERAPVVADIPAELLSLYDKLRLTKNGVAVTELRARQCAGCMMSVDPAELAAIRAKTEDEVVRCEQCQRILVRTSESGL
jgi:predicted  nucleic acid-binding Zn-ribbon protein